MDCPATGVRSHPESSRRTRAYRLADIEEQKHIGMLCLHILVSVLSEGSKSGIETVNTDRV